MKRGTASKAKLFIVPQAAVTSNFIPPTPHRDQPKRIATIERAKAIGIPMARTMKSTRNIRRGIFSIIDVTCFRCSACG